MEISRLPEGCIAHILSLTSPPDSFSAAAVSSTFRSAAESDAVWDAFLPPDCGEILSRASEEIVSSSSKKELFARLCRPLLIDGGSKSFMLDRRTGKKCYMLSPRMLHITWGDTPNYWNWISLPNSRFSEVAELRHVCWLEITGKLETAELSPKTTYVAYIIFKLRPRFHGIDYTFQEGTITLGEQTWTETVSLHTSKCRTRDYMRRGVIQFESLLLNPPPPHSSELQSEVAKHTACARSDGWMELTLGEFFNEDGHQGEVSMSLLEVKGGHWKSGLIVGGIELRPKS